MQKPPCTILVLQLVFVLFFIFHLLHFLAHYFCFVNNKATKIAEWIIPLIGIITPWYFLFSWLFLTNKLYSFHVPGFEISYPLFAQNNIQYAGMILILILAITGGFFVQSFSSKQIVQVRKSWWLLLLYLIVALFIPFINNSHNFEYWILAVVPVSAFVACAFYYPRIRWIPRVIHWIMVGFVIY